MGRRQFDSEKISKAIGLKVREIRNKKGWTLEECEEHGWLNWRYLQAIESGQNITVETITNLANLFGVHPGVLFQDI